jgi:hypothetical protein
MYFCEKEFYMKKIILSITVIAMFFVGCKKEETKPSDSSSTSSTPRISKETIYSYYPDSFTDSIIVDTSIILYSYDSKGRLASLISDDLTYTYSYTSANLISVLYSAKYENTTISNKFNYFLDSKGKATKMYEVGNKDTTYIIYSTDGYSSNSSPLDLLFSSSSSNNQIEVVGGNIVKNGNISYEYNLDKINVLSYSNRGIYFMGKDSKNLLKSSRYNGNVPYGKFPVEMLYAYEFDSKNRVVKTILTKINSDGSASNSKTITKYEYIN